MTDAVSTTLRHSVTANAKVTWMKTVFAMVQFPLASKTEITAENIWQLQYYLEYKNYVFRQKVTIFIKIPGVQ